MTYSYDQSADRAFNIIGRLAQDAVEAWDSMSMDEKLKIVSTLSPIAMKRIPDRTEAVNLNLSIDDTEAKAMMETAQRNLLIYKELRERKRDAQDIHSAPTESPQDIPKQDENGG